MVKDRPILLKMITNLAMAGQISLSKNTSAVSALLADTKMTAINLREASPGNVQGEKKKTGKTGPQKNIQV